MMLKDFIFSTVKRIVNQMRKRLKDQAGITLVEVMAVVVIMGVLSMVAVPSVVKSIDKAKQEVCNTNLTFLERMYTLHLVTEGIEHSEVIFSEFMQGYGEELCDSDCEIIFAEGKIECSEYPKEVADVPYL
jgi:prepilin-type N-terminal cleavage/methylation domain-containing protein